MKQLTAEEKSALLLKNLSPKAVESVLSQLKPEHRDTLRRKMQTIQETGNLDDLLSELAGVWSNPPPARGSSPRIARPEIKPAADASAEPELSSDPLIALTQVPVESLARALTEEKPATVSLLLNSMDLQRAGEVYRKLPSELRREVSVQLSAGADCPLEIIQRIAKALVAKCKTLKDKPPPPDPIARFQKIADMLRMLDKQECMDILATMEQRDPATAASIKALLYRFDDILRMDNRSVQRLLSEIDTKGLSVALADASQEIKDKFLTNMSKRAQEALAEEMEFASKIPAVQIEQARKAITDVIQRLDQANEITLS